MYEIGKEHKFRHFLFLLNQNLELVVVTSKSRLNVIESKKLLFTIAFDSKYSLNRCLIGGGLTFDHVEPKRKAVDDSSISDLSSI
jgi:hypothetical protein